MKMQIKGILFDFDGTIANGTVNSFAQISSDILAEV